MIRDVQTTAITLPVVVLSAVLLAFPPVHADVAPYLIECGATGILSNPHRR